MNDDLLHRMLAPLMRGIHSLTGRGVLTGTDDGLKMQNSQMTALDGEVFDEVERPQQYGQISVPLPGAETFFTCLSGDRDQAVILVVEDKRTRPTGLPAGDSGLYHHEGHRLRLTRDGRLIITCKTVEVYADESMTVDTPRTILTGDVEIQKGLNVLGESHFTRNINAPDAIINGKSTNTHDHEGDNGGRTGPME